MICLLAGRRKPVKPVKPIVCPPRGQLYSFIAITFSQYYFVIFKVLIQFLCLLTIREYTWDSPTVVHHYLVRIGMRSVLTLSLGSGSLEKELHFHGLLQQ